MNSENKSNGITIEAICSIDRLISRGEEILLTKYQGEGIFSKLAKAGENEYGIPTYKRKFNIVDYVDSAKFSAWAASVKVFIKSSFSEIIATEYIGSEGSHSKWVAHTPSNVEKAIELLKTIKLQLQNSEVHMKTERKLLERDCDMSNENYPIIFLSHKSDDKKYGHALAELIRGLGVKNDQLIYTTHPLHKIPLGQNIYEYLKSRLGANTFMIFLLSDVYFESSPCLNEMGAAWLAQSDYTSVFVPDFNFQNKKFLECAIDNKQIGVSLKGSGMCKQGMLELKNKIITMFGLSIEESGWQYLIDKFMEDIK